MTLFAPTLLLFFINAGVPNVNVDTKSFESGGLRPGDAPPLPTAGG